MSDSAQMRADFEKARRHVGRFTKGVKTAAKSIGGIAVAALGIRGGISLFGELAEKFDRVHKLSQRFEMPVESVQRLSTAAELSGSNLEQLAAALNKATVGGVEASQGMATYQRAFSALNIDVDKFNQASPDEKLSMIAKGFNGASDEASAFSAVYRILGKSGAELIPLLKDMGAGIDGLTGGMKVLNAQEIESIKNFNDQLTLLKSNLQAQLAQAFAGELNNLQGVITSLGESLITATKWMIEHKDAIGYVVKAALAYKAVKMAASVSSTVASIVAYVAKMGLATTATNAETAALVKNTMAQRANSASRMGGGGKLPVGKMVGSGIGGAVGKAGAVGMAAVAGWQIGKFLGDSLVEAMDDGLEVYEPPSALAVKMLATAQKRHAEELKIAEAVKKIELEYAETSAEAERGAALRRAALEMERKISRELKSQIAATRSSIRDADIDLLPPKAKIKVFTDELKKQIESATLHYNDSRKLDGKEPVEDVGGIKDVYQLARQAEAEGDLVNAKLLYEQVRKMQELEAQIVAAKRESAALDEAAADAAERELESKREAAAAESKKGASQKAAKEALTLEMAVLALKARGRDKEAESLRTEVRLRQEAKEIAEATGLTEREALILAKKREQLNQKKNGGKNEDESLRARLRRERQERINEKRGQRVAGGVGGDGQGLSNQLSRLRDRSRNKVDQDNGSSGIINKISELVNKSDDLLRVWDRIVTSS